MSIYDRKIEAMIDTIKSRGFNDERVLNAMRVVPRHKFVPGPLSMDSYRDSPLPIGHQQTISQPYIVALMTHLLDVKVGDKILEIGTGSGYQAAVLAELGATVFTIERHFELWKKSAQVFKTLGYDKIINRHGDGSTGWSSLSPFDGIIVTAAGPDVPSVLIDQIKSTGHLVIPVGSKFTQELVCVSKLEDGSVEEKRITGVSFVPLIGKEGWKE